MPLPFRRRGRWPFESERQATWSTSATALPSLRSRLGGISEDRDRRLVEGLAEFDEEGACEAGGKALESTDPNAIRESLERGEVEAPQRAKDRRDADDTSDPLGTIDSRTVTGRSVNVTAPSEQLTASAEATWRRGAAWT